MAENGTDRTKHVWTEEELDSLSPEELAQFTEEEREYIVNGGVQPNPKKKGYAMLTIFEIIAIIAVIIFVIYLVMTK